VAATEARFARRKARDDCLRRPVRKPEALVPCYIDGAVFFFGAFLAGFLAVLPVFCAANAAFELITAAAGSSTAAPKAQRVAATSSLFMFLSIVEAL
jgi:hypothetical protein